MNYRLFVTKKDEFDAPSLNLFNELQENFKLPNLKKLKIFNIYDIFNIQKNEFKKAKNLVFSEIQSDEVFENLNLKDKIYLAYEPNPGQFDQRGEGAKQCLNLLSHKFKNTQIISAKLIVFEGFIDENDFAKIKSYLINPIESRQKDLNSFKFPKFQKAKDLPKIKNFTKLSNKKLRNFLQDYKLAMSFKDLKFIQNYFKNTEKRNPTQTEIKVFDTYWSDHCRHTTFETILQNIKFPKNNFGKIIKNSFEDYLKMKKIAQDKKDISLMNFARVPAKFLRKIGKLNDLEISNEINACSIFIDVDINGKLEKYLLMFKNETHNHPTEIEPFGGASTCLGGAIRDPLSGRAYVYQGFRISGSANPLESLENTLPNKLPQRKITKEASDGYSSYGNQIGIATSYINEIYDKSYKAKRMEVGAVIGAVKASHVKRKEPKPNDIVILLGGKTGRDGIGGATGSSKILNDESLKTCNAEVQKGNALEERKIQRFFRNKKVLRLIKKCNDFGAGGVAVAAGELARGVKINLDKIPKKYYGLNGTELAISESQERMAVVISKKNRKKFIKLAKNENLMAVKIAKITKKPRLIMTWRNKKIVDISREFLDTNGVKNYQDVQILSPKSNNPFLKNRFTSIYEMLGDLNICSQKGLVEKFDSSIGAGAVFMPFGGLYQMTPVDFSMQKIPLLKGQTNTASIIAAGYNPSIFKWSPFHGGIYAVIESISKIVSAGGDYKKIRLSFQEYFEKLGFNPKKWGKVSASLLGTIYAQKIFQIPAIGGKDSMSGSFKNLNVVPTLISFAFSTLDARTAIGPEFKNANNKIYLIKANFSENFLPNIEELKENYEFIHKNIKAKIIISAMALKHGGIAEAVAKMSFGNKIGVKLNKISKENLYALNYGSIVVESKKELNFKNAILLGETLEEYNLYLNDEIIDLQIAQDFWLKKLNSIFPYKTNEAVMTYEFKPFEAKNINICQNKSPKPRVLIPVFPGTNCEFDSKMAFEKSGAKTKILIFQNQNLKDIKDSISKLAKELDNSQILMLSGGFSAADEPDGSGKFIANILMNEEIKNSIYKFLARDGLILGICNGFQALIKSGLLPYEKIGNIKSDSPTLTFNKINRHISQMARIKITSNLSPWFANFKPGDEFIIPVSHGEGRFICDASNLERLFKNGQIASQYVNLSSKPTNEFCFNPNGSTYAIEALSSPDGKILGKMSHSERFGENLYKNIKGNKIQNIFENGIKYFK